MGSAFHQLCPRYSGTLTPTAPTAIRLWDTFTFTFTFYCIVKSYCFIFRTATVVSLGVPIFRVLTVI